MALLAEHGPAAIQARAVAEAAHVSTASVYYHLGGLPELVAAVTDRGFQDLGRALTSIPAGDDPVTDLFSMALATHEFGRSNPHLYDLMFGLSTRGGYRQLRNAGPTVAPRSRESFSAVYAHLVEACRRLVTAGRIRADADPATVAEQLWACVHGFVTLELGGYLDRTEDPVGTVLQPMTAQLLVGLGDTAERAVASHAAARPTTPRSPTAGAGEPS